MHASAVGAVGRLLSGGRSVVVVPQNLYEFWVVATRPAGANGLGLTPSEAETETARLLAHFPLLPDPPGLFDTWRSLVVANGVLGGEAHDARLVAAMDLHGVPCILTFDDAHFARYARIAAIHPSAV